MASILNTVSMEGIAFLPLFKEITESSKEGNTELDFGYDFLNDIPLFAMLKHSLKIDNYLNSAKKFLEDENVKEKILQDSFEFDFSKIVPESQNIYDEKDEYIELAIETAIRKLEKNEKICQYFSHRMSDKDYYATLMSYSMEKNVIPKSKSFALSLGYMALKKLHEEIYEEEPLFAATMSEEECLEEMASLDLKVSEKLEELGIEFLKTYLRNEPITRKDWRMKKWGTADNATETIISEDNSTVTFRTSNPPIPVIRKLSEQHPDVRVSYCYSEEGAADDDCTTKQYVGGIETGEFIKIKVDFNEPVFIEKEAFAKKYGYTYENPLMRNKDTGECIYILFDSMLALIRKENLKEFYHFIETELEDYREFCYSMELKSKTPHVSYEILSASVLNVTNNELMDLYKLRTDDIKERITEERNLGLDDDAILEKLKKEFVIYYLGDIERTGFLDIEKRDEYTAKNFIRSVMNSMD